MTESRKEGSPSEEKGEGKKVENNSQATTGARPGRVGEGTHGKTIQGVQAAGSLLKGYIMCPDHRCIRHRGTDHGCVYPLGNFRAGAPVAPRS